MQKTLLVIFMLAALQGQGQDISWRDKNGVNRSATLSGWENGWTAESYARKYHMTEVRMRQYKVRNGKRARLPVSERTSILDTGGYLVKQVYAWKGRIRYSMQREIKRQGTVHEISTEYLGKNNKFRYASSTWYDTVVRNGKYYRKEEPEGDFVLRSTYQLNDSNRYTEYRTYTKKGKPAYLSLYEYYTPDKLKRISSYNGKGKLKHQYNYTCDTVSANAKAVKQTNYCMRTDKDPMGNTIEIEEQRFKNKLYLVICTYTPDKRLLQVKVTDAKGRVRSDLRYTYNEEKQLTSIAYFHKNSRKPASEKRYIYQDKALQLTELYSGGKKYIEYEFQFKM